MIVASHQVDILPYPGFWNRVASASIMDLGGLWDWFSSGSDIYHHRVKVGYDHPTSWLTLPLIKPPKDVRLRQCEVMLDRSRMSTVWNKVKGTYQGHLNWKLLGPQLEEIIMHGQHKYMWELNHALLLWVRRLLNISTPFSIPIDPGTSGTGSEKIFAQLSTYKSSPDDQLTYLSGSGGKKYLDVDLLSSNHITVVWHQWCCPIHGYGSVSILSLLMDFATTDVESVIKNQASQELIDRMNYQRSHLL